MRKWISLLLCAALLCAQVLASAVSYTLPEKMSKQLEIGSGLKGNFTLRIGGEAEWAKALEMFSGAEFQIRGIAQGEDLHYYVYQTDEQENQWARTDFYRTNQTWYLRSELLNDQVYAMPEPLQVLDSLTAVENPSFASAAARLLTISATEKEEDWDPVLRHYEDEIEQWMSAYAEQTEIRRDADGNSVIDLNYTIPMTALKTEIIALVNEAAADEDVLRLLRRVMSEEQLNVYLNGQLVYYYEAALTGMNLEYDAQLSRTVSVMGDVLSAGIELPLDRTVCGFDSLAMESGRDGQVAYTLTNDQRSLTLVVPEQWPQGDQTLVTCWLIQRPSAEAEDPCKALALRLQLKTTKSQSEDEDTRSHEIQRYELTVDRDVSRLAQGENAEVFEPFEKLTAQAELHYSSKYAQSSPTTLAFDLACRQGEADLALTGQLKTASPWIFSPFAVESAVPLLEQTPEALQLLGAQLLTNLAQVVVVTPPAEETAETEPAAEPVPELEAAPEAEAEPEQEKEPEAEGKPETEAEKETEEEPAPTEAPKIAGQQQEEEPAEEPDIVEENPTEEDNGSDG